MAKVIQIKSDLDFTGSNGGKDIPCWRFDGEPTAEQQAYCRANNISMEWANGREDEWEGMRNYDGSWNVSKKRGGRIHAAPVTIFDKIVWAGILFLLLMLIIIVVMSSVPPF